MTTGRRGKVHSTREEVYSFLRAELLSGMGEQKDRCEPLTLWCHCATADTVWPRSIRGGRVAICVLGPAETSSDVCRVCRAQLGVWHLSRDAGLRDCCVRWCRALHSTPSFISAGMAHLLGVKEPCFLCPPLLLSFSQGYPWKWFCLLAYTAPAAVSSPSWALPWPGPAYMGEQS